MEEAKESYNKEQQDVIDPMIPKIIDAVYTEFLRKATQRSFRKKVVHPFLNHALSIFGPMLSVIASLMTFLIFLMLLVVIMLLGWILKSKDMTDLCVRGTELGEKLVRNSPLIIGSPMMGK